MTVLRTSSSFVAAALAALVLTLTPAGAIDTSVFSDDFDGSVLDSARWEILEGGGIAVEDGLLVLEGGYHKQVVSTASWAPDGNGVVARARMRLAGDYQKFGWNVNARGTATRGYYFDTHERGDVRPEFAGFEHFTRAVAYAVSPSGDVTMLLDELVPVAWYEFHEFAIEWTPSSVVFRIDDQEVARLADAFDSPLPIGVWNDRAQRTEFDWVDVSRFVPIVAIPVDVRPGSPQNAIAPGSRGVIQVAALATDTFDPLSLDVFSVRFGAAGTEAPAVHWTPRDADGDGRVDLVLHFRTEQTSIGCGATEAVLTGKTVDGTSVRGSDAVRTVGCR
jgi:hypothetical protein